MDPTSLRFSPTHEWVHIVDGLATVGISKFAIDQLTDLIMIDLPAVGSRIVPGKSFGEIESVKAVSDLYAPIGGEVIEVNGELTSNIQLLSEDPYGAGWLVKIKLDEGAEAGDLLDHSAYEKRVAEEAH